MRDFTQGGYTGAVDTGPKPTPDPLPEGLYRLMPLCPQSSPMKREPNILFA
ncbi:hypothetical protein L1889_03745 [Paenalcaligenes niemegkensis]|uniref:hypothetical protein n=1 Tax=Paenalcaligenes niemegkensis TaxID=2895469 RepID=UPI001EE95A7C|nr:hypothetical protein [Paenalcaligenes niemegkensis]MCQ9615923.1 hypothetical protein [Paenalcaligenes niemegkensis]